MADLESWAHLLLGAAIITTALLKLYRIRGKPRGYGSIWIGMALIATTEVFSSSIVYQPVDHQFGPGWSLIMGHGLGIIGVGFGINATYIIMGRGSAARRSNCVFTAVAFVVSVAPWVIAAPTTVPAILADHPMYYAPNWQSTIHWLALTVFLVNRVYGHLRIGWQRVVVLREEGSLVTGIQIMIASQALLIIAIITALALQGAWLLGWGPELFDYFEIARGSLAALAVALLGIGVGWPHAHQRWQRMTAHRPWSRARRHLRLLHGHWSWVTSQIPGVSVFPETITGRPASAEDMQWQRTRIVTEIYDVHRRLAPYYDLDDHQRALDHVAAGQLSAARSQAAVEHICTSYALSRYHAGERAVRVRRNFTTPSRTAETTATKIVRGLRLISAPDVSMVISTATREERSWSLAR